MPELDDRSLPNIFFFENYRELLKLITEEWRKLGKYSTRGFAKTVGLGSSSFVKMVIDGQRKLSESMTWKIANAFGFNKEEIHYFDLLVKFNQAEDLAEKDNLYKDLITYRSQFLSRGSSDELYDYYSKWFHVALRELLSIREMQTLGAAQLAERLGAPDTQIMKALKLLENLGFIEKTSEGWKAKDELIQTPDELQHLHIRNFHREMIDRARSSVDEVSPEERDLSSLTLPLSPSNYLKAQKMISELRLQMNAVFAEDSRADQVYQINFQIFPLTKKKLKEDSEEE